MKRFLLRFRANENGAISVEWVVLTAAMVGFLLAIMSTLGESAKQSARDTGAFINDRASY
ncbi:Flp family type IVb pilin [Shimia sp. W99]